MSQWQLLRVQTQPELIVVQARNGAVVIQHADAQAGRGGLKPHRIGAMISAGKERKGEEDKGGVISSRGITLSKGGEAAVVE